MDRDRAADLIRKLKGMTLAAGASEAEALAAAAKARELADTYGITDADVIEGDVGTGRVRYRPIDTLWPAIASYCHVEVFYREGRELKVIYAGRDADVLLAQWLHVMLKRHIDSALKNYKRDTSYRRRQPHRRRKAAEAFVESMALELAGRLSMMTDLTAAAPKLEAAGRWLQDQYGAMDEATIPAVNDRRVDSARTAGTKAGRDVAISTPVTSSAPAIAGLLTSY